MLLREALAVVAERGGGYIAREGSDRGVAPERDGSMHYRVFGSHNLWPWRPTLADLVADDWCYVPSPL